MESIVAAFSIPWPKVSNDILYFFLGITSVIPRYVPNKISFSMISVLAVSLDDSNISEINRLSFHDTFVQTAVAISRMNSACSR